MTLSANSLHKALKDYFGFDEFKSQQEKIVKSVLDGKDTFVIMPTGGGKSLCYQLPALIMEGTALVISPLIALMKNQVDSIRSHSQRDEVAHFLNSSLTKGQMKQVKQDIVDGNTKLLFVAPETLTKEENIEFFKQANISFVAVDEAHCISEWGHDFRPEYRRIKSMLEGIGGSIPIIALTATATPKVQMDILKNLNMKQENTFVSSFNRPNLFYEVLPKGKPEVTLKKIVQIIHQMPGKSGIIYVQSRKSAEAIAQTLQVNDIKAAPYHAGLEAKLRSKTQDDFLMERMDVIVATIAFGMGIDKPDVRFVIHYDIPKSIENYYQETGRAGRDGLGGRCIAFFAYKDILKLEKFLRDKPVAERELSHQLMQEIMAYSETASCRRKFLLHYFGEQFDEEHCGKMCDNCKSPKEQVEVSSEMVKGLKKVLEVEENMGIKPLVDLLLAEKDNDKDENFWYSIYRNALLQDFLYKDIETYGLLKMRPEGHAFLEQPSAIKVPLNNNYKEETAAEEDMGQTAVLDELLIKMLKDLRRKEAQKREVPPYVIFQDPSLEDMATQYPITMEDMSQITGVSKGKAERYGQPFLELIKGYVEEHGIERPTDFVIKQVAQKSKIKVNLIQGIDRKVPLEDLADANNITMDELLQELYAIVTSGTRLNIDYYLEDCVDEYAREEIYDYFLESETDQEEAAFEQLKEDDITLEEIKLMRIKFMSEMAN
ncbi:MAG: RecQ family ATP-dependent DNA helicase [Saprospiraceae bacterium]|jgi:ATP-dependent DNA helicase RecQ